MAKAFDSVLQTLRARGDLDRFWNFDYTDDGLLEMFTKAMNETNFRGVTVSIRKAASNESFIMLIYTSAFKGTGHYW